MAIHASLLYAALALTLRLALAGQQIEPLSVPPSLFWDGDDGLWSTFYIQIGTPGQMLRVLPCTSADAGSSTWAVLPQGCIAMDNATASLYCSPSQTEGCSAVDVADCGDSRGRLFFANESTSWSTSGLETTDEDGVIFNLATLEEVNLDLDYNAGGSYGFDSVGLGLQGSGMPTLSKQLVAGIASTEFYLGTLGLSPYGFNFSDSNDPIPSLMTALVNQSHIPSSSWGYTAGAQYRNVFGSLTLGGYDRSRFVPTNASFTMGADYTRDLLVSLQSITYSTAGSSPLLASSIDVFIDSLISELWLPVEVCSAFQQQFNLTWDGQRYLVSDAAHTALLAENPSFTFTLGQAGATNGSTVDIVLPYAAFDLSLSAPGGNSSRYFPLKQGQNSTQYVLGRSFLQEAYIIADYERFNFSVSQATFPDTSVKQNLVAIQRAKSQDNASNRRRGGFDGLSVGVVVGIAVAGGVTLLGLAGLAVLIWRRRKQRQHREAEKMVDKISPPSSAGEISPTRSEIRELDNSDAARHELMHGRENVRYEMNARVSWVELDARRSYQPTHWI